MPGLMELLSYAGNAIDLPASSLRDLFAGSNPFDQWATPFSSDNRTSGRDLLNPIFGKNKETGMSGWLDDPMEGVADVLGFGAEMVLDPLNLVSGAGIIKALDGRRIAKVDNLYNAALNEFNAGKYGYVNTKLAGQTDELVNPITQQAPQKLLGYTPERPVVYHGGHDWSASATPENPYGMFDVSRLKTGEGGNAYGPGAYFAEAESTSERYRDLVKAKLKRNDPLTDFRRALIMRKNDLETSSGAINPLLNSFIDDPVPDNVKSLVSLLDNNNWLGTDIRTLRGRDKLYDMLSDGVGLDKQPIPAEIKAAYDSLEASVPKAKLYQLDMPHEAGASVIRWEDPLYRQPEGVQSALREKVPGYDEFQGQYIDASQKFDRVQEDARHMRDNWDKEHAEWYDTPEGMRIQAARSSARHVKADIVRQLATIIGDSHAAEDILKAAEPSGELIAQVLLGGSPRSVPVGNATALPQLGVSGTKNLAASTGRNTYNYAIWDQDLLNKMRIRAIDGERVPINPTTLVQQVAKPRARAADPAMMQSMNPMRPIQQLPGLAAPVATTAVYNILARQNNYGGVM